MTIKKIAAAALIAAGATPAVSMADVSANIGWASEYVFRGIYQTESSASAGIDYESDAGFYIGTWGADVGNGLETDLYFGYGGGNDDFSWSVGYTGYYYTDDFDDTYNEINLGIGAGIFALDVAVGEWDGFGMSQDYLFTSVSLSPGDWYVLYGTFSEDFDGDYLELGYGTSVMDEIDLGIALLYSDELPVAGDSAEWNLTFSIGKSFSLD